MKDNVKELLKELFFYFDKFSYFSPALYEKEKKKFFYYLKRNKIYFPNTYFLNLPTSQERERIIKLLELLEENDETLLWKEKIKEWRLLSNYYFSFEGREKEEISKKLYFKYYSFSYQEFLPEEITLTKENWKEKFKTYFSSQLSYFKNFTVEELKRFLNSIFSPKWKLKKAITVGVNFFKYEVYLPANFNSLPLTLRKEILIHEIFTHMWRYKKGKERKSLLGMYGYSNYIFLEEGLALFNTFNMDYISSKDLFIYYLYYKLIKESQGGDFWELFNKVFSLLEDFNGKAHLENETDMLKSKAYDITFKLKVGTGKEGINCQPSLYWQGFSFLQKILNDTPELNYSFLYDYGKIDFTYLLKIIPNIEGDLWKKGLL